MKVFVTGATGFIGTGIVQELLNAGHRVLGLARSDTSASALLKAGAEVHRGDLQDLDSLRKGAENSDGVIHAGFIHDFSRFKEVCEVDRIAIETLGTILAGSNRPFIVTSGTALIRPGTLATEDMETMHNSHIPRVSEAAMDKFTSNGVHTAAVRLSPSVHGKGDLHGFLPTLINIAKQKGFAAYIGDGQNRWNAVHRLDAVHLFRLALEKGEAGSKYHAVGDEAISLKVLSESIGKHLNVPVVSILAEKAEAHFGWFAAMAGLDCPVSSKLTQERLNWHPSHPTLLEDLESGIYFQ